MRMMNAPEKSARITLALRSVTATWIAVAAAALTSFLLTPYILHDLGDEGFGLWVLIAALTDYYFFLQVGVRSAILRYVSHHLALGDRETVNRTLTTSFYFYLGICLLALAGTALAFPFLPAFFLVRAQYVRSVMYLFLLAGTAQALDFPLNVFEATLEAVGRFDQIYTVRVGSLVLRVISVILVLRAGAGLLGVGAATILSALLPRFIEIPLALRAIGGFSFHPKWVSKRLFRKMLGYGIVTAFIGLGQRISTAVYPLVIGRFLSAASVTLFALPIKLLAYPMDALGSMTEFVNPLSSQLDAQKDYGGLRQLLLMSAQGAFLIFVPLAVLVIVLGRTLLGLWVGSHYMALYPILVLLTFGLGANATQCSTQSMLFGIGRHKGLIWFRALEALAIVVLGIGLLKVWGLIGFAWAMTLTLTLTNLVLIPRHVCRILGLPLRTYFVKGCLKPCVLALPFAVVLREFNHTLPVQTWTGFIVTVLMSGLAYVLTLTLATFWRMRRPWTWLSLAVLEVLDQKVLRRRPHFEASSAVAMLDKAQERKGAPGAQYLLNGPTL